MHSLVHKTAVKPLEAHIVEKFTTSHERMLTGTSESLPCHTVSGVAALNRFREEAGTGRTAGIYR